MCKVNSNNSIEYEKINWNISANILNNSFDLLFPTIDIVKNFNGKMFSSPDDKKLKTALITMATSIELLLKSKIADIAWEQIFQNPGKANKEKLRDGNFYSIKFEDCLHRIENISNIKFNTKTKNDIEKIRQIRNKITHFYWNISKEEFISLISIGFNIFIEFYRNYIFDDFCESQDRTKDIDYELKEIKEYVKTRLLTLKEKYKTFDKPKTYYFAECSNCYQDAFIIKDKETVKCVFCGDENNIQDLARFYSNFDDKIKECPECNFFSMIAIHEKDTEQEAWDCIICGNFINRSTHWVGHVDENRIPINSSVREEYKT